MKDAEYIKFETAQRWKDIWDNKVKNLSLTDLSIKLPDLIKISGFNIP